MSKDLSYRVWDDEKKEYSDKPFSLDQYGLLYVQDEDGYWEETGDRYIIEFPTGLKDKNGKEIYEGDIVIIGKEYALILYDNSKASFMGCFYVDYKGMTVKQNDFIFDFCPNHIKVIGNIHENPELVGGGE